MASKADTLWEDVLEHVEANEREEALELCRQITSIDPNHAPAWKMTAKMILPMERRGVQDMPSLSQAASAYAALQNVVKLAPDDVESWALGGILLVDHLGMLEEALNWWQQRRIANPTDVTPLIEQIAILVRLGMYPEASDLLEVMFEPDMEQPNRKQLANMDRVRQMVDKASKMEKEEVFRPQDPNHPRWDIINRMKTRKPMSETFFLFTFVMPIVFIIGTVAMQLIGGTQFGFILVFFIILGLFWGISRAGAGLLQSINRHALDLERAIDVESTSGKVCISTELRGSKLYNHTIGKRSDAFRERHDRIVSSDEILNQKWLPQIPNFSDSDGWWSEEENQVIEA
jgi:hypothetical protein